MKKFTLFGRNKQLAEPASQKLYKKLCGNTYSRYPYKKSELGEDVWVVEQVIGEYWKPRYLMDERAKTAVEFMSSGMVLQTVSADDIDWPSLEDLPQKAIRQARLLFAAYPTFVRTYKDGVAAVDWELNPDGQYYMDEDGYGMTDDDEITIYGYVDRNGKPLIKFRTIKNYCELKEMEKEARRNLEART